LICSINKTGSSGSVPAESTHLTWICIQDNHELI
jgi:hypothetical protein